MQRDARLRKGTEFDSVYEKGTAHGGPFFVLRVLPNDLGRTRWGFAVGKRLLRSAVDRNRVKRRLKEAARAAGVAASADIILTARHGAIGAPYDSLISSIQRSARKAGLMDAGRRG